MYQGYYEYIDEYGNRRRVFYKNGYRPAPAPPKRFWKRAFDIVVPDTVQTWVDGVGHEIASTWMQNNQQLRQFISGGYGDTNKTVWCDWFFGGFH